jgi:hypothetical protein
MFVASSCASILKRENDFLLLIALNRTNTFAFIRNYSLTLSFPSSEIFLLLRLDKSLQINSSFYYSISFFQTKNQTRKNETNDFVFCFLCRRLKMALHNKVFSVVCQGTVKLVYNDHGYNELYLHNA